MYTTDDLATLFNTSTESIRQWSKDFSQFLEHNANPGPNRARQYTENDVKVMVKVAELKARRIRTDEVITALLNGERGEIPDQSIQLRGAEKGQIARLKDQVNTLQLSLSEAIASSNRKDGTIELLERQLADAQKEIRQLIGENAVLKSRS